MTAGVPEGSKLGPTLWNATYNGELSLKLPKEFVIVSFTDDVVTTARDTLEE